MTRKPRMKRITETGSYTNEFAARRIKNNAWRLHYELVHEVVSITKGETVVDVGAGVGLYVAALRDNGVPCIGIDGTKGVEELSDGLVLEVDIAEGYVSDAIAERILKSLVNTPQWALSIEVGEHIPRQYESAFFDALACFGIRGVILTWASPEQDGTGHVNCRTTEYVTEQMVLRGYYFDEDVVVDLRSRLNCQPAKSIMIFRKA